MVRLRKEIGAPDALEAVEVRALADDVADVARLGVDVARDVDLARMRNSAMYRNTNVSGQYSARTMRAGEKARSCFRNCSSHPLRGGSMRMVVLSAGNVKSCGRRRVTLAPVASDKNMCNPEGWPVTSKIASADPAIKSIFERELSCALIFAYLIESAAPCRMVID